MPLHPEILSLADYEQAVTIGGLNAIAFLNDSHVLDHLRIGDIQHVHFLIFERVHPWAGQFRIPGQIATISGLPCAEPPRIGRELALSLVQMDQLMAQAGADEDGFQWLAAIAFFHVRFERIHPFLDGNGRTGRSILAIQFEAIFGQRPSFADQSSYRAALYAANQKNLAPLMNFLGASAGLPTAPAPWTPSFRLAPRFVESSEEQTSLLEDFAWSRFNE